VKWEFIQELSRALYQAIVNIATYK